MEGRSELALALAVFAAAALFGAAANSVDDVVNTVRDGLENNRTDQQVARALHHLNLKFRLDNRTAEELESIAPGPKSIAELERLLDVSSDLPLPAASPVFPSPPRSRRPQNSAT